MPQPVQVGKKERMSYSRISEVAEIPNLIQIQTESYKWFIEEGLKEVFDDFSPIKDYSGNLILEFIDHRFSDGPKYSQKECKERDVTYAAPLKMTTRLVNKETGEVKAQEIFVGDLPIMTDRGTFIYNGAERVVVTQLVRSPAPYYEQAVDKSNTKFHGATIIPNRGAWLEYSTEAGDYIAIRIDRARKQPITTFLRALGLGTDEMIYSVFGADPQLAKTVEKDITHSEEEGLKEIYKKMRPGDPPTEENARSLILATFFDSKRYDLAKIG